jgi:serine/threonine-protein kinase
MPVPTPLDAALGKALAKNPADRFATTAEFADALSAEGVPVAAPSASAKRRLPRRRTLLGVGAVVVVAAAVLLGRRSGDAAFPRTAIAVLPFENLSIEGPHSLFAPGLHDELLTQLAKVAALTVIGRASVMAYAGVDRPLPEIAAELGVGTIVEASVQVVEDRLRVNVQLLDAQTGVQLWADRYDRTLDDAFAVQSDIALHVVEAVGATLGSSDQRAFAEAPTGNPEAYRFYLQGREYHTRPGYLRQNQEIAQQLYEQALALDPGFALAHAALSRVHSMMYWLRYDPSPVRAARLREEAEVALRLAPELPEAHIAMGVAHYSGRREYRRALQEFRIALDGLPNDAELWMRIGWVHRRLGNWDEVLRAFDTATRLDPRNADLFSSLGGDTYQNMHRYAEAVRAYDQALSLAPDNHVAAVRKGQTYVLWQGQLDTLRAVLSRLPLDAEMADFGTTTAQQLSLLLWERQADSILQLLATGRVGVFEGGQDFFLPASLYAARAHQMRGDRSAAQAACDSARLLLDSVVAELPDDWRVHAARGLALAGLGRRDEALREARWLQQSMVYREDARHGGLAAENRAQILAQAGEADTALDEIERLLTMPSWLSVHTLRLEPLWDPLREHPRFQRLLEQYGN